MTNYMDEVEPEAELEQSAEPAPVEDKYPSKAKRETPPLASTEIPPGAVISLGALVINGNSKNSTSVRWVQRRLIELGHLGAGEDLPGALENGTVEALAEYQANAKVSDSSVVSRAVIESLMKGTPAKVTD